MPQRKRIEEPRELTAQPNSDYPMELGSLESDEPGLSVAPEDLGDQFLSAALEKGHSQRPHGLDGADVLLDDELPSDDSWLDPSFEGDQRAWERLITGSLKHGRTRALSAPPPPEDLEPPSREWDAVDLTDEAIQEASLLDHEGAELGEVESPEVRTDDTHTHGKRRGGHVKRSKSVRPSPR